VPPATTLLIALPVALVLPPLIFVMRTVGVFGQRDYFYTPRRRQRIRTVVLGSTLIWSAVLPFVVALVFFLPLAQDLAREISWIGEPFAAFILIPAALFPGYLGSVAWKRVTRHVMTEEERKHFLAVMYLKRTS
jgi:hypothetical protein